MTMIKQRLPSISFIEYADAGGLFAAIRLRADREIE
jgi:hypothetical protein